LLGWSIGLASVAREDVVLEAISDVLMDLLQKLLALVLFLVLDGYYDKSLNYCAEKIEEVDVVHCEDSGAGLVIVRASCCEARGRHMTAKL
jgi:hypothetical protein